MVSVATYGNLFHQTDRSTECGNELGLLALVPLTALKSGKELIKVHYLVSLRIRGMEDEVRAVCMDEGME